MDDIIYFLPRLTILVITGLVSVVCDFETLLAFDAEVVVPRLLLRAVSSFK